MRQGQVYSDFDFYFIAKTVYKCLWNDHISSLHSPVKYSIKYQVYTYTSRKRKRTFLAMIIRVKKLGETHIRLSADYQNHPSIADPIFRPQRVQKNYFPLHETPINGTLSYVKVKLILNKKKSIYPDHLVKTVINNYFHPYNLATTTCKNIRT